MAAEGDRAARRAALLVLGLGALLFLLVLWREPPRRTERLDVYRIPPGTAERVRQGLSIDSVLPQRLATTVGAGLEVINEDTASHVFGPFVLAPGQRWSQRYGLAGAYSMTCSLYPDVDLVIDVEPSPAGKGAAQSAYRLWAALWAAIAAGTVAATALSLRPSAPGAAEGPSRAMLVAAWTLAGATVVLVALEVLALSRVAPWRTVLSSRAWPLWVASVGIAAAVPVLAGTAAEPRLARPLLLSVPPAVALAVAAGLAPALEMTAIGLALATTGAGLVAAAVIATARGQGGAGETAAIARLAACGATLVLVGLPWPAASPPWLALRGGIALALGVVVLASVRRPRPGLSAGWRGLVALGGLTAALVGVALLFGALLAHVEAVAVPLAGNPVPADDVSIARGEALWSAHCAECHAPHEPLALPSDRELFELLVTGHDEAPGLAYRLDMSERGDLVNYARSRFDSGDAGG